MASRARKIAILMEFLDSDDSDEDIGRYKAIIESLDIMKDQRHDHVRIQAYIHDVVPHYVPSVFKSFFRVSPTTFEDILQVIATLPGAVPVYGGPGREPMSLPEQLLVTLMYLGSKQKIKALSDKFDRTDSVIFDVRNKMCQTFVSLLPRVIRWPCVDQMPEIANGFNTNGFEGIIGAIDGTHIEIPSPPGSGSAYYNRKQQHSVVLQAVCNSKLEFTHVMAGWPGRVHDSRILRNSDIWENLGPQIPEGYHILGDGAYPLRTWLMTPFRDTGNLSQDEKNYNRKFSARRQVVERAFGLLKGRFPRLKFCNAKIIPYIVNIITACCVIHNMVLSDQIDIEIEEENADDDEHVANDNHCDATTQARAKRNMLVHSL